MLVGAGVGDAVGAGLEGEPMVDRLDLEPLVTHPGPFRYTDDTHMTIGVAESLLQCGGFDGARMAIKLAADFRREPWRGYGQGPPKVFAEILTGARWDEPARALYGGAGSLGNGAAMRVAPIALRYCFDLERVCSVAAESALITHSHPSGVEGTVLQAVALAVIASAESPPSMETILRHVRARARLPAYLERLALIDTLSPEASKREVIDLLGNGIEAHRSVLTALWAFACHRDSFVDTVLYAVSLGGDTDTIASMAGALAGAALGEGAIPTPWRSGVEGVRHLRFLADGLLDQATRSED